MTPGEERKDAKAQRRKGEELELARAHHHFNSAVVLSATEARKILSGVTQLDHRICFPLLSAREQAAWQLPEELLPEDPPAPTITPPAPVCPHCHKPMPLFVAWFAGGPVPRPDQV